MELTQLRYFQVAAYYQHISRAAEELNVSQPALSSMISRLERELGVSLFDHRGRSIYLNRNGQQFLIYVNRILSEVNNAKAVLQDIARVGDNSISLAVTSSQFLFGMHTFTQKHPEYKWNLSIDNNESIAQKLDMDKIDFAIISPGIYGPEYESSLLLHDTFKLAVHKDHPLARKKFVTFQDLQGERFIALTRSSSFQKIIDNMLTDHGISPHYVIECDHLLRRELINANVGVTIASRSAVFRHLFSDEICFLDIDGADNYYRDIVLVYRKLRHQSHASRAFIEYIKKKFSEV